MNRDEEAGAISAVTFKACQLRLEVERAIQTCRQDGRLVRWLDRVMSQAAEMEETGRLIGDLLGGQDQEVTRRLRPEPPR